VLKQIGENSDICLLELSRNFGHQTAVYAGLQHATGEAVIIMDTDLQDRPEVISDFIQKWEEGAQVVYAIRKKRKENPIKRFLFYMFYKILNGLSNIPIPAEAGMFSLIDRQVVNLLANIPERNRFIPGLRAWVGFNQVGIPVERDERGDKIPRVSFIQLVRLATDAIISFSWIPLRVSTVLGILAAFLSITGTCIVLYKKFISLEAIPGWTSILLSIFFFGAVQLIIFGIIGEYLGRIYEEVKRRPPYVVRKVIGRSRDETLLPPNDK
jgi:dolichol-phosphate mannosyltransferase